jgi:PiT family inorganic phosphate transporter
MVTLIAAVASAIFWGILTWILGMPSSASHATIGGLIGAAIASAGWSVISVSGLLKVVLILFISPVIGFLFGYLVTRLIMLASWNASPKINDFFKKGQIATSVGLALSYGANDAQKTMGIITLGLVTSGYMSTFVVPSWVILCCALMIALGTSVGGWKLIKTLGAKFYRIRPMDGFATQISSAVVILGASLFGGLVSTTQVVSTAIMGVGSAERVNKVRWTVAREILTAWILTIPMTALLGAGIYWVINHFAG